MTQIVRARCKMAEVEECELTTEQKDFLEECLVEFANRYTDEDEEYKRAYERVISIPPIMSPWHGRPRLTANRSGNRNSYHGRQYDRDRQDQDRYDRDKDHYESRHPRNDFRGNDRHRDDGHRRFRPY